VRILTIQYVRGLAALLVVIAHNSAFLGEYWVNHIPGALGVDVFFIVSGFIMTFITRQVPERADTFLIKRFFHRPDVMCPLFLSSGLQQSGADVWFQPAGATLDAVL